MVEKNNNKHITCPHCSKDVNIEQAIIDTYVSKEMTKFKKENETTLRKKIEKEYSDELLEKDNELENYSKKLVDQNRMKSRIKSLERQKQELESDIAVKYEEKLTEELDKKETTIKEKDIQIEQMKNDMMKMQTRANQGSVQLQGEAQELKIEEWLRQEFPEDVITEIKKGARGADVIHEVMFQDDVAGKMCIESKRAKDFQNSWINKVKEDAKNSGCMIAVIITDVLPKNHVIGKQLNGVWICTFTQFKFLINSLRLMILEVNNVIGTQLNKTDKTSLIYNYVTGHEFCQEMESIVGTFMKLQDDLDSEIRQHQTQWKKREKELSILVKSTSNIYGSLKGIAGNSIKRIESLDIPKIESRN